MHPSGLKPKSDVRDRVDLAERLGMKGAQKTFYLLMIHPYGSRLCSPCFRGPTPGPRSDPSWYP